MICPFYENMKWPFHGNMICPFYENMKWPFHGNMKWPFHGTALQKTDENYGQ